MSTAPPAEPTTEAPTPTPEAPDPLDKYTKGAKSKPDENENRPTPALRFSISEEPCELKRVTLQSVVRDEEGDIVEVKLKIKVALGDGIEDAIPQIGAAVSKIREASEEIVADKNAFSLAVRRDFANCRYQFKGGGVRLQLNADVDGRAKISFAAGAVFLELVVVGSLRAKELAVLARYLGVDSLVVTIDPAQQNLFLPQPAKAS